MKRISLFKAPCHGSPKAKETATRKGGSITQRLDCVPLLSAPHGGQIPLLLPDSRDPHCDRHCQLPGRLHRPVPKAVYFSTDVRAGFRVPSRTGWSVLWNGDG